MIWWKMNSYMVLAVGEAGTTTPEGSSQFSLTGALSNEEWGCSRATPSTSPSRQTPGVKRQAQAGITAEKYLFVITEDKTIQRL